MQTMYRVRTAAVRAVMVGLVLAAIAFVYGQVFLVGVPTPTFMLGLISWLATAIWVVAGVFLVVGLLGVLLTTERFAGMWDTLSGN